MEQAVTRRAGLGRGLDALLPAQEARPEGTGAGLNEVPLDAIVPNPRQPRHSFDDDAIGDLAESIRALGILQPLLVRELGGGRYELVAGERRVRASRLAGLERVPVMTVETDDRGSLERALVENLHREDLNPIEEAEGYRQLIDEANLTQEELGQRLGRSRVTITNALRLLSLPPAIQKLLVEGRVSAAHGRALLGLQDNPFQLRLAQRVGAEGISVRETEDLVRRYQSMTPSTNQGGRPRTRPPIATEAQRQLSEYLQTRVRVDVGKRKGRIVMDFVSTDELERLLRIITGDEPGATSTTSSPG
ncbi:MAG TPA: ParB/RepB/Spo0J family partition protein [Actinomycetota bacterium]|nr:ParB/RepB/Spo0J family partition protein [Actinomycetota bacterium]